MLCLTPATKIYLACQPVDMRKGIDGLFTLVKQTLDLQPFSGHLFVFYSRRRDRLKVLFWDHGGFVLYHKRLEKGRFQLGRLLSGGAREEIDTSTLGSLLAGLTPCEPRQSLYRPPLAS